MTLIVAGFSAFWMIAATLARPLLPDYERPSLWLTRIVDGDDLAGSLLITGRVVRRCFWLSHSPLSFWPPGQLTSPFGGGGVPGCSASRCATA